MADLPATADTNTAVPHQGLTAGSIQGLSYLPLLKQFGVLLGLAASIAIGVSVALWSKEKSYRPLYGSLDNINAAEIVSVLDASKIPYKIDQNSGALLVDAGQIHDARLRLAAAGVGGQQNVGFELLDKEQPLGTSQFMEGARYRRSLEGELARTIASIQSIRSARVHLAIPRDTVFIRDARKPSASVFVDVYSGRKVSKEQVRSVTNLVASSIPELTVDQVTVVDQRGNLLSRFGDDMELALANQQYEYTRRYEESLVARVHTLLEPLVGLGRFRAEVSADIDFTEVEQTDEVFNPDLPAIRSEQRLEETRQGSSSGAASGVPGALSNQPPGVASAPEQAAQGAGGEATSSAGANARNRLQSTKNYELDRTISHTRHHVGKIRRLSVAVAVDDIAESAVPADENAEEGQQASSKKRAWTEAELEQLTSLLRDAVGYDAVRGDSVNVINSAFVTEEIPEPIAGLPIWQQPMMLTLAKWLGGFIVVVLVIFRIIRPMMKSLSDSAAQIKALEQERDTRLAMAQAGDGHVAEPVIGPDGKILPSPANPARQMDAIKTMIADDPGRAAQVVKKWVTDDK